MKKNLNLELYLVTDRHLARGRPLEEVVRAAIRGGVTIVQLREKECSTREFVSIAQNLLHLLKPKKIPLIINDRIDVALAVNADGVHLGQDDMPYSLARDILGTEAIIGLSVESIADAQEAEKLDVDYLGVSPIFFTPTKTDLKRELGFDGLKKIKNSSRHKLVGIGGLNVSNAGDVIRAGADGVAVVSAICSADDPQAAASQLRQVISKAKSESLHEII